MMGSGRHRAIVMVAMAGAASVLGSENAEAQTGPERFAHEVLDLEDRDEYGPVLTADGETVYLAIRRNRRGSEYLAVSHLTAGGWSEPEPLPFTGLGVDKEPFLSRDGSRLYFGSRRATPEGENRGFEIWMSERQGDSWGEPVHLSDLSTPGTDNYPSVAANRNIYFGSDRMEGRGRIHRATWTGNGYAEPEVVMAGGQPMGGADPYIDPQERFIIHSSTREGGYGEGDLYLTLREGDGWGESVNLGTVINTADYEFTPFVSRDEEWLYFSRGWGEMWRIRVAEVPALRAALNR